MRFDTERQYGQWDELPGYFTGIAVSYYVFMKSAFLHKGFGREENNKRLQHLKNNYMDYVLATVGAKNEREQHILIKNGWKLLDTYLNSCSDHTVSLFGRSLEDFERL